MAIEFFTQYKYKVGKKTARQLKVSALTTDPMKSIQLEKIDGRLLYLWSNAWIGKLKHWDEGGLLWLRYTDESTLLGELGENKTAFVAYGWRWGHLAEYFELVPDVKILSKKPMVYQVSNFTIVKDFGPPRVGREIGMLLAELRETHPENYQIIRNGVFTKIFGFTSEQVDSIADMDESVAGVKFISR